MIEITKQEMVAQAFDNCLKAGYELSVRNVLMHEPLLSSKYNNPGAIAYEFRKVREEHFEKGLAIKEELGLDGAIWEPVIERIQKVIATRLEDFETYKADIAEAFEQMQDEVKRTDSIQDMLDKTKEENAMMQSSVTQLTEHNNELSRELNAAIEEKTKELEPLKLSIQELEKQNAELSADISILNSDIKTHASELEKMKAVNELLERNLSDANRKIESQVVELAMSSKPTTSRIPFAKRK